MKKFFFSCLAIAAIASCAKTEDVYTPDQAEIKLAPVTSLTTKTVNGVINTTTYPKSENFNVYAYWANEPAGSVFEEGATTYLNNVKFVNKGEYWGGATTYYWPKNGSLRFAAYSPSELTMAHYLTSDVYELNGLTYPVDIKESYDILVAPTSESYTAQTAAEKVSVVFEHALSWINFKVTSTAVASEAFTITDVIVNNVNNLGNLVADMKAGTKTWSTALPQTINVYNSTTGQTVNALPTVIENADKNGNVGYSFLVLPQPTTSVTIKFTQNALSGTNGTPSLENQEITIPLTLDENQPWEAGKHYTYTIIFDLDEILINPSVEEWEEVVVNDVPATVIVATTEEELATAINNGGQVRLGANITTTKNFRLDESVNIDLNGYTLTANVGDEIFVRVNNGATFTLGRGTVVCDDYIVSVNEGGVAVINDGVYLAETTAVNVNGGKAYITGGKFQDSSSYNGQYLLNHVDAKKNIGLIDVTGGTFVNFDPSAASSETTAMNFVHAGYKVVRDGNEYTVVKE